MRKDIIFLVVVFIGLAGIAAGFYLTHQDTGASVEVTVDGAIYGTYPLDVDKEIPIQKDGKTTNLLVIKDGKADVTEADCPDKLCGTSSGNRGYDRKNRGCETFGMQRLLLYGGVCVKFWEEAFGFYYMGQRA